MKIATTTDDFKDYVATDDVAGATKLLAQCGFRHVDVNMLHAVMCGFKDEAYFSNTFRAYYGCTPGRFAKSAASSVSPAMTDARQP